MLYIYEVFLRIFYIFLGMTFAIIIAYYETDIIFCLLVEPLQESFSQDNLKIIYLGITEGFTSKIKVSFLVGVFFTLPLFWIQILFFISPALYFSELRFFLILINISSLFLFSTLFIVKDYFLPRVWSFFLSFQGDLSYYPSLIPYLETFLDIFGGFLLTSQIPILFYLFVHWKWLDKNFLVKNRRFFILVLLIWSALITPPDFFSLIFVFLPLFFIYEFFVWNIFIIMGYQREINC